MQKFKVRHCVGENTGKWSIMHNTQYGHTSLYCNLELHIGDHLYRKRGGMENAFSVDKFDYRYQSLAKSLGVYVAPDKIVGALLGNFYEQTNDGVIRFRITDDAPTDVVYFWKRSDETLAQIKELEPTCFSIGSDGPWVQAVFPLDRKNTVGPPSDNFDDFYDFEPDSADLYGHHWCEELSGPNIIHKRLRICGF